MNSNAKTILGVLAAGAAGVAVGMLLAPEKGENTRQTIKDTIAELGEKLYSFIGEGKERAEEAIDNLKGEAKGLKDDVKHDVSSRVQNAKDAAKDALS